MTPFPRIVSVGLTLGWSAIAGILVAVITFRQGLVFEIVLASVAALAVAGVAVNAVALRVEPGWWRHSLGGLMLSLMPAIVTLVVAEIIASTLKFGF
jgi:hypothetical protein